MLSPLDLQNKKVVTKKRKYDKIEMDEYLDLIFENYKELYNQNQELQKQIKTLSDGVQYYRSIESTMQKALVLAEKTSKETKDAAVLKAEAIEKDANSKASKIISEANQEYESIKEKCLYLVQQFNQYKMQLKQVATAQLELITSDTFDVYSPELDAIRNAKYSLPNSEDQENITAFTDTSSQTETESENTTEVEVSKDLLTEPELLDSGDEITPLTKSNHMSVDKNPAVLDDLTPAVEAETSSASIGKDNLLTPIKDDNKKQMDKTVILPDIKDKLEKSNKRRKDMDDISILTADTIDLRNSIQEAQASENKENSASSESSAFAGLKPENDSKPVKAAKGKDVANAQVITPMDADVITPLDARLQDIKPQEPELLEPVIDNEKETPTLDSLLQNMNLGKKKKKKGQEEDPFEFLGSVDDF